MTSSACDWVVAMLGLTAVPLTRPLLLCDDPPAMPWTVGPAPSSPVSRSTAGLSETASAASPPLPRELLLSWSMPVGR